MNIAQAIRNYITVRTELERIETLADAAWLKWFQGKTRNGAAAARLANRVSYLSADLATAEGDLWKVAETDDGYVDPEIVWAWRSQ